MYVAIAGAVVNRRSVLLKNFVLNGKESASNPLLHIHTNRWGTLENITYLYKKEHLMTTKQIKSKIKIALDNIPENLLEEILAYLEEIQDKSADRVVMSQRLRRILSEDKELLEKLAQ